MVQKLWGLDTDTGQCGWFLPVADAPDVAVENFEFDAGVLTITMNNGVQYPVTVTIPAGETEQLNIDASTDPVLDTGAGTITFETINDVAGTAGAPYVLDISSLITLLTSTPHPDLIAGDNITITGNDVDGYTISAADGAVDTDTFATFDPATNIITFADGTTKDLTVVPDGNDISTMTVGSIVSGSELTHTADGVTTILPPLRDFDGNIVRRDRVQATLADECGNLGLPITTKILTHQAANPVFGVIPQGPSVAFDRATLQPLNNTGIQVLQDDGFILSLANPSDCATLVLTLDGHGRLDPQWDDLNQTAANWSLQSQFDTVIYYSLDGNPIVDLIRHSVSETPPNPGGVVGKFNQIDGRAILFLPPLSVVEIGRRFEYITNNQPVPERTPVFAISNMPYISAFGNLRY